MSQDKPMGWDLVTKVCFRDYRNKSTLERSQGGEEQWMAWHTMNAQVD